MARGKKNKPTKTSPQSQPKTPQTQISGTFEEKKVALQEISHHGPIPHPLVLKGYDELIPGAAERIIRMAEMQARHRQELESIAVKSGARDSLMGLIFGFIIGLVTVLSGSYCVLKGHSVSGTILGGVGLVGLVGVFVYGSRQRSKEREAKQKMIENAKKT